MSESKKMNEYLSIKEIAKISKPTEITCRKYIAKFKEYFTDHKTCINRNGVRHRKYKGAVDIINFIYDASMFNRDLGWGRNNRCKDIAMLLRETYSKEKHDAEDCDFRVGDKVFCLLYGNGVVKEINNKLDKDHSVSVMFENPENFLAFNKYGNIYGSIVRGEWSKVRFLFHGHDLRVTANEKIPVRIPEKWLCVYMDKKSENIVRSIIYKSENEAKEKSKTWTYDGWVIISGPTKIEGVKNETN